MTELATVKCCLPRAEAERFAVCTGGSTEEVIRYLIRQVNSGRIEMEEYRNVIGGSNHG